MAAARASRSRDRDGAELSAIAAISALTAQWIPIRINSVTTGRYLAVDRDVTLGGSSTSITGRRQGLGKHRTVCVRAVRAGPLEFHCPPKGCRRPNASLRVTWLRYVTARPPREGAKGELDRVFGPPDSDPDRLVPAGPRRGCARVLRDARRRGPTSPAHTTASRRGPVVRRAPAAPRPATEVLRMDRDPREDRDGGGTGPRSRVRGASQTA